MKRIRPGMGLFDTTTQVHLTGKAIMNPNERNELIDRYAAGYDRVTESLHDFPADQLTAHPIAGKWSAAEIVHHLADSEMASAIRLRNLLAQEHAVIFGYDQDEYAIRLKYNEREIGPALDAFRGARATSAQILRQMTDDDWERVGWHTESGTYSTETWLRIYAQHAHGHAEQIDRLRVALAAANVQTGAADS
jgi:hypothetical protein